jgi:uracil-DNA glycosylase family 4
MNTVLLIDGNPLMWRAAYAHGEHYVSRGIIRYFFEAVEKFDCSNALLCWDSGKSRWRSQYYPEYKAQRETRKQEFDLHEIGEQKKAAQKYLAHLGVRNITVHGVEADDILAWFAEYFTKLPQFDRIIIVTRDRDLWQLANSKVHLYDPLQDKLVDPVVCEQDFGVSPKKVVDYKSLVGDSSDNIQGVKGIGDKTAKKLIDQYQGIEGFLDPANKKEISKSRLASKLLAQSEDLELSYQLVKLPTLEESWAYLTQEEYAALYQELTKSVVPDPLSAQVEYEVLGCQHMNQRLINSLDNEAQGLLSYVAPKSFQSPANLGSLDQCIQGCAICPLGGKGSQVFSEGYTGAQIMLLGRSPSFEDLEAQKPFSGASGELLDKFLEEVGLSREYCWVSNTCKCVTGDRPPTYGEMQACSPYLRAEIDLIKPKMIIAFGNEAMSRVAPYKSGVTKHVGEILEKPEGSIGYIDSWVALMVTPSTALRSTQGEANFEYGTQKIKEFLGKRRK